MLETLGYIIIYAALVGGAVYDERIALISCLLIGPIIGAVFIGGLIVCVSDMYKWLKT